MTVTRHLQTFEEHCRSVHMDSRAVAYAQIAMNPNKVIWARTRTALYDIFHSCIEMWESTYVDMRISLFSLLYYFFKEIIPAPPNTADGTKWSGCDGGLSRAQVPPARAAEEVQQDHVPLQGLDSYPGRHQNGQHDERVCGLHDLLPGGHIIQKTGKLLGFKFKLTERGWSMTTVLTRKCIR